MSLVISAHAAIRVFQSKTATSTTAPFSPRDHFLHVRLSYNPLQYRVTPSTMFRVEDAQILPLAHFKLCPEVFENRYHVAYDTIKALVNSLSDRIPALPMIINSHEAGSSVTQVPINHDLYRDDSLAVRANAKLWLLELKRKVERGHVYGACVGKSVSGGRDMRLGKLRRVRIHERGVQGQKWEFVPLTKKEMKDCGYTDLVEAKKEANREG